MTATGSTPVPGQDAVPVGGPVPVEDHVLVLVGDDAGSVPERALEAITVARGLGTVHAVCSADQAVRAAPELARHGAGVVHALPAGAEASSASVADALARIARVVGARLVLLPATASAAPVAALVARALGAGLVVGAAQVRRTAEGRVATAQPALTGSWRVEVEVTTDHAVLTLAPHAARAVPAPVPGAGRLRTHEPADEPAPREFFVVRRAPAATSVGDLAHADVVVVGGRGTGGDFAPLAELAELLGGEVGATGVATEAGWASRDVLVGQSGVTVAPRLYLGAGVSGAVHHRAGMEAARTIVAVDADPDAPIFEIADFGVVGDLTTVLPGLIAELRRLRPGSRR